MSVTERPASVSRRIEYMRLRDIPRAARNVKAHDREVIAGSIDRWSFADAPILDERTGRLVAGHGRLDDLEARRERGQDPPGGIETDADGEWLVPVQRGWASRSDLDSEAFAVAHNRAGEKGGWDERALAELLEEFADHDLDLLHATGFDQDELADIMARYSPPPSLDSLADTYGDPTDRDLWPRISLAVPRELRARYMTLMEVTDGEEHEKFAALVGWAEMGRGG